MEIATGELLVEKQRSFFDLGRHDEQMSALDEKIKRMRAQRLRLERDQRKRD
jgi:hypothetical protein